MFFSLTSTAGRTPRVSLAYVIMARNIHSSAINSNRAGLSKGMPRGVSRTVDRDLSAHARTIF